MSELPDQEKNSPEGSDALISLLGKLMGASSSHDTQSAQASQSAPAPPLGTDVFSSLLSNPELIGKLPQIISMIKPIMEGATQATPSPPNNVSPSVPTGVLQQSHKKPDDRTALLYAIKPYLKKERQDAIDYMVKLSRLGDILKTL